jgi:hypothetical protein
MQKRTKPKKKHTHTPRSKNHKRGTFIQMYSLLMLVSVTTFALTSLFIHLNQAIPSIPTCANSKSCTTDLTEKIENNSYGTFEGKTVFAPFIDKREEDELSVLGIATTSGEKHIYVDLSTQTLIAYQGTTQIFKTFVSTGKWGRTPTGNFHIWEKLRATRMAGGEGADAYDLPNVPYVMYFYHDFGLHGAYWHDNFGHAMSHGCVNLRQVDAKTLFEWADGPSGNTLGTAVSICDRLTSDNQCIQENPVE